MHVMKLSQTTRSYKHLKETDMDNGKKEDGDSRECVSFLVFIAFLKSQGEGSKKGWEKEEDENLSQIPD